MEPHAEATAPAPDPNPEVSVVLYEARNYTIGYYTAPSEIEQRQAAALRKAGVGNIANPEAQEKSTLVPGLNWVPYLTLKAARIESSNVKARIVNLGDMHQHDKLEVVKMSTNCTALARWLGRETDPIVTAAITEALSTRSKSVTGG